MAKALEMAMAMTRRWVTPGSIDQYFEAKAWQDQKRQDQPGRPGADQNRRSQARSGRR